MRAVIFINGEIHDLPNVQRRLRPGDYLVGADGGTRHICALGLRPALVVGDLDSLDAAVVEQLRADGVPIERHPVHKDQTDLELAIECALAAHADEVLLVGATGGRLDQTMANVLILAQRNWPVPLHLLDGSQQAMLLRGPHTLTLDLPIGATVSAIPLGARVTGITYRGLTYPLEDATLELGSTRGVSNAVASSPVTIEIARGLLLVVWETRGT